MFEWLAPLEALAESRLGLPGWLVFPALVVVMALVADGLSRLLIWRLCPWLERTTNRWDDVLLVAVRRPLRVWIWGFTLFVLAAIAADRFGLGWLQAHLPRGRLLFSLAMLAWTGIRLVKLIERRLVFPPAGHRARPMDATTASAISKIVGAVILVMVALVVLQQLGMKLSGLLAFGGLGGIVVGFAAKDALANFFGGLAVHLDQPFKVGDWVCSPDRDIEGIVEEIGWRLTRIRNFESRPLYVPNSAFSNIIVENPSRMHNRRIFQTLGLRYEDIGRVGDIVAAIRRMLDDHEYIDRQQASLVNFKSYGDYSLELFIHAYTRTTDWAEHQDIQQDVLLRIADIIDDHQAAVAMPARELHFKEAVSDTSGGDDDAIPDEAAAPRTLEPGRDDRRAPAPGHGEPRRGDASSNDSNQETDA